MADETIQDQPVGVQPEAEVEEDEFDRLRRKSTLTSSVYDDMDLEDEGGSTNPLSRLTVPQIIILLILLVIDIIAVSALLYWIFTG